VSPPSTLAWALPEAPRASPKSHCELNPISPAGAPDEQGGAPLETRLKTGPHLQGRSIQHLPREPYVRRFARQPSRLTAQADSATW